MNKKEQKELKRNWALGVLLALLGFFVNIAATSFYDMYFVDGFQKRALIPFVIFGSLSIFIGSLFFYLFENLEEVKDKPFRTFLWRFIKSWFKK